jgi:hypothetical protein
MAIFGDFTKPALKLHKDRTYSGQTECAMLYTDTVAISMPNYSLRCAVLVVLFHKMSS